METSMLKKNNKYYFLSIFLIILSLFSCKQNVYVPVKINSSEVPKEVSDISITSTSNNAILSWKSPKTGKLFGVELFYVEGSFDTVEEVLQNSPTAMIISPNQENAKIVNLKNDTEYTFVIQTVYTDGSTSEGLLKKITPVFTTTAPLTFTLSTTPELSNTTKTITVDIDTEVPVLKVVYERDGSAVPKTLLESPTAKPAVKQSNSKWTFDVEDNGTYAVAVLDAEGRREREEITVQSFDKTPPTNVSDFTGVISGNDINLSWTNPTPSGSYDSPLSKILISYKKNTETEYSTPEELSAFTETYTISNFDSTVTYYDFIIEVVDDLGNSRSSKARAYVDVSKKLQVGDVILKNGNILRYADRSTNDYFTEASNAVAVIYSVINDFPLGLGVKQSNTYLEWAKYDSVGYNTDFEGIKCNYTNFYSGGSYTHTFAGDTDGSDNWDYICSIDPSGTTNPATNYPAFNFALNYAVENSLTGDYANGWYLPSIAELYGVYKNKIIVNEVLDYLGESQISSWYWSSSQSPYYYDYALILDFSYGDVFNYFKDDYNYVLVIRAF